MIKDLVSWAPFVGALIAFLASHAIPARPPVRRRLVTLMGERLYLIAYSLLSLVLLAWLFRSAAEAPFVELWPQQDWQPVATRILVPLAFALGTIGLFTPNPLSLSAAGKEHVATASILTLTRHPFLWALALWAAAHLIPNGDLAHVILFGTMLTLCFGGMVILDRRARRRLGPERWAELAASRPLIPLTSPASLRWPSTREVFYGALGLVVAIAVAYLHGLLVGVPAI